jgi:steroid 5-alpha reductase family enzyme
MIEEFITVSATGFVALFVLMCFIWLWFRSIQNAAVVDVGWGNGFAIMAVTAFFLTSGWLDRKILVAALVVFWGERLTLHLLIDRVLGGKPEDGRYTQMREKWKTNLNAKFFGFFQFQTLLVVLLSAPFTLAMMNPDPAFSLFDIVGAILWLVGLIGESVSDAQLRAFKGRAENKGKTCRNGLWKYSRHPNYFFEWIIWVGYGVIALGAPYGWIGMISPIAILYILTQLTGIPLTEEQAIRSRGDDYREYQRTTSAFVPWFNKQTGKS